jgi:hypothetical protein
MIMAKQMKFESMGSNMPRQISNQQQQHLQTSEDHHQPQIRMVNPLMERKNSVLGTTGSSQAPLCQQTLDSRQTQAFIGDFSNPRSHRGASKTNDMTKIKESINKLVSNSNTHNQSLAMAVSANQTIDFRNSGGVQKMNLKRRNSRNETGKLNPEGGEAK